MLWNIISNMRSCLCPCLKIYNSLLRTWVQGCLKVCQYYQCRVLSDLSLCHLCPLQVLPVLPAVVPVLLEALSGMEDARLNYVEQV